MITPLLTQLTYEGLVDELVGIKNCKRPSRSPSGTIIDQIFSLRRTSTVRPRATDRPGRSTNCWPVDFPSRPWPCSRSDKSGQEEETQPLSIDRPTFRRVERSELLGCWEKVEQGRPSVG